MSLVGPTTKTTFFDRLLTGEDADAWDEFVRIYTGPLLRLFRKLGVNPHDAEALTQDVLGEVAVYLRKHGFDRTKGQFRGFLYRCAVNARADHLRRLGRLPRAGGDQALLESGIRYAGDGPREPEDHTADLHFRWFLDETLHSAVRRALEHAREHFPPQSYRAFEITTVTAETTPDGTVYQIDVSPRADSARVTRAVDELGLTRDQVWDEKHRVKEWVLDRLRELVPGDA